MYLQLCIKKTLFINLSVVCAMQTMSASRVDTCINVWRNTSDQIRKPLQAISKS